MCIYIHNPVNTRIYTCAVLEEPPRQSVRFFVWCLHPLKSFCEHCGLKPEGVAAVNRWVAGRSGLWLAHPRKSVLYNTHSICWRWHPLAHIKALLVYLTNSNMMGCLISSDVTSVFTVNGRSVFVFVISIDLNNRQIVLMYSLIKGSKCLPDANPGPTLNILHFKQRYVGSLLVKRLFSAVK